MEVYADLMVILNFLVDFFLLLGTNRLSGFPPRIRRLLPAAALGGLYSGLCLLPGLRFLAGLLWRCVCLVFMVLIAFGRDLSALRRGAVFLLLSLSMAGIALSFQSARFGPLLVEAGLLISLCSLAFGEQLGGRDYVPVTLRRQGHSLSLTALVDTGNSLRDPITGESVLVISGPRARELTGLTEDQLRSPMQTLCARPIPGLRLIPFRSVGTGGMLLGLRFPDAVVNGRQTQALVAFAPEGLGEGSVYEALIGGRL